MIYIFKKKIADKNNALQNMKLGKVISRWEASWRYGMRGKNGESTGTVCDIQVLSLQSLGTQVVTSEKVFQNIFRYFKPSIIFLRSKRFILIEAPGIDQDVILLGPFPRQFKKMAQRAYNQNKYVLQPFRIFPLMENTIKNTDVWCLETDLKFMEHFYNIQMLIHFFIVKESLLKLLELLSNNCP